MAEHARAGIKKMAIYMKGTDLFLYMEVEDYAKAVPILSASPAVLRWEEYMAPIMEDSGDEAFDPANAFPASLPEVFFWERRAENEVRPKMPTSACEPHRDSQPSLRLRTIQSAAKVAAQVHDCRNVAAKSIKLAGAAWSWVGATFAESAAIYRALWRGCARFSRRSRQPLRHLPNRRRPARSKPAN